MAKKRKSNAGRIFLGIGVWFALMCAVAYIGMTFELGAGERNESKLYSLFGVIVPVVVAVVVALPKKIKSEPGIQDGTELTDGQAEARKPVRKKAREYVINPQTMVFHKPSCPYAKRAMWYNTHTCDSRSAILSVGYKPCKRCKP